MAFVLILSAIIIFLCVFAEKFSDKMGMPALIMFLFIGMLFGTDGIFKFDFENYKLSKDVATIAVTFIMFYGGFNTKWKVAKSVAVKSGLLSTIGVVITAGVVTAFCSVCLKMDLAEGFLIGAVLSSTDAASVFAILRKQKVNLKYGTPSMLEIESGSNDPVAYLMTLIAIDLINKNDVGNIPLMIVLQIVVGVAVGIALAEVTLFAMTKTKLVSEGLEAIFLIAMIMLCFGATSLLKGNELLSVYLLGIIVGNSEIKHKQELIPFFNGITSLAQIIIFFVIGLLTTPHRMPDVLGISVLIALALAFIARPIAIFLILLPFKCHIRQCLLVSWAGLRGATSSLFAMIAMAAGVKVDHDLFHIVFVVSLISVISQGALLPNVAKWLKMVDSNSDIRKTFNDYQEEISLQLMRMHIVKGHEWENRMIKDVNLPTGSLALMIKRGKETIITKGNTVILAGDNVILNIPRYTTNEKENLKEKHIVKGHKWCGKTIGKLKLAKNVLIAMIIRGDETIIPDGKTVIHHGDIVVLYKEGKDPIEGIL